MDVAPPTIHRLSENSWLLQFQPVISPSVNAAVHALAAFCRGQQWLAFQQVVPAYHSLLLQVPWQALLRPGAATIQQQIAQWCLQPALWQPATAAQEARVVEVPVCYHPSLGTDWPLVEAATGLPADQVVALHTQPLYQVYMIGFLPGFAYMGPVHPAIAVGRKAQPVPVPAGAVGIAGSQTGIYPTHSPGGWHIIGHTPLQLFNAGWPQPALLQPGQQVRLQPISIEEYHQIKRLPI